MDNKKQLSPEEQEALHQKAKMNALGSLAGGIGSRIGQPVGGGSQPLPSGQQAMPQVADTSDIIRDFIKKGRPKMQDPMMPSEQAFGGMGSMGEDPYDLQKLKDEEDMKVAGRLFNPRTGWQTLPKG
jgi:hypothetical protein